LFDPLVFTSALNSSYSLLWIPKLVAPTSVHIRKRFCAKRQVLVLSVATTSVFKKVGVDLAGECGEDDAVVAFLAEVTKKVSEWVFLVEELAPRVLDVVKEET
jgi:hypothetical protein